MISFENLSFFAETLYIIQEDILFRNFLSGWKNLKTTADEPNTQLEHLLQAGTSYHRE